ncbi:MAG: nucleoside hydrolase [Acidimicrobiia bacterium]
MPRPIIIDSDPGQDDAVAILLALGSPEDFDILGITAVAGNVPLSLTEVNSRKIVELSGRTDVDVFAGCDRPMRKDLVTAEYVHGPTGLDGADLPEPSHPLQPQHAVDFIIEALRTSDRPVTLCVLGPLTNIGMALEREPAIAASIDQIVLMGGGLFEGGNTTPAAEFNIYVDPHAASVVFTSGIPITMMPLDVTHKALTTPSRIEAFRNLGTRQGDAVAGLIDFFDRYDMERYGTEGAPLHDPCVLAYLIDPTLFTGRDCHVEIVVDGPAEGMTMIDWWSMTGNEPNATVMGDIDADRFFALLVERIGALRLN